MSRLVYITDGESKTVLTIVNDVGVVNHIELSDAQLAGLLQDVAVA